MRFVSWGLAVVYCEWSFAVSEDWPQLEGLAQLVWGLQTVWDDLAKKMVLHLLLRTHISFALGYSHPFVGALVRGVWDPGFALASSLESGSDLGLEKRIAAGAVEVFGTEAWR